MSKVFSRSKNDYYQNINENLVCEKLTKKECSEDIYEAYINRRVTVGNDIGTIKYFGKLDNSDNLWVGVDWDDEKRGKHDGCYKGIRYFYTRKPTSGSFIKAEKCEFGQSFLAAIKEKYTNQENENNKNKENGGDEVVITKMSNKEIVFVGSKLVAKKQSSLSSLSHISLNRSKVATAFNWSSLDHITHSKHHEPGFNDSIHQSITLPRLIDLDLSNNLLSDWVEIKLIVQTAYNLKTLNLQHNRITKNVDFGLSAQDPNDIENKSDYITKGGYEFVFPSNIKNDKMFFLCNIVSNFINQNQHGNQMPTSNRQSQTTDKELCMEDFSSNSCNNVVNNDSCSKSSFQTLKLSSFISTTLQELCLDDMALEWRSFLYLTFSFPYLTTLIASNNDIRHCSIEEYILCLRRVVPCEETVDKGGCCIDGEGGLSKVSPFTCPLSLVTSLNLEGNLSLEWNEVLNLAVLLPLLQSLSLNHCNLGKIYLPRWHKHPCNLEDIKFCLNDHSTESNSADKKHQACHIFLHLNHLSIIDTGSRSWTDYDQLHLLSSLSHLQCSSGGEELPENQKKDQWGLEVIARIGGLKYLNRSQVDKNIRKNGEIAYLKKCAKQLEHEDAPSVHMRHPRLTELVEKYGMPHRDEVDAGSKLLKSSVINVHLVLCSRDAQVMSVRTRKLPLSMTVGKLKMVVRKAFAKEVASLLQALTQNSNTSFSDGVSTDNDDVTLSYSSNHNFYTVSHDQPDCTNQKDSEKYIKPGSRLEVDIDDIFKEIGWYSVQDHDTLYIRLKH